MKKLFTVAAKLEKPDARTATPVALKPKHKPPEVRTTGPDVLQPERKKSEEKPGTLHPHHIPIFDHKGRMRGHVGPKATAATVSRFIGQHGAKLGKKDGKTAWIGPPPPPPKKPQVDPTAVAVAETQAKNGPQEHKLSIELNQAKGSVTKNPTKPETSARPKRG